MDEDVDGLIEEKYLKELESLKINSKPLINSLTMMAEDVIHSARIIVQTIEKQLIRVKPEGKLPILYLVDSIVKNIKKDYIPLFTQNIVSTFCGVFEKVDDRVRSQMFKLRQTWNDVFPAKKLQAIDMRIHQMDSGWPVAASTSTIHVNPKFLNKQTPVSLPTQSLYDTSSTISLMDPPGEVTEAQMREQLLIKQKQLLELQQRKLELELIHTQAQLEEQTRKKKMQEELDRQQLLLRQAELARQQTMAAASIMATYAPAGSVPMQQKPQQQHQIVKPVPPAPVPFSNDPRLNRRQHPVKPNPPPAPVFQLPTALSVPTIKEERKSPRPKQSTPTPTTPLRKSSPLPQPREERPVPKSPSAKVKEAQFTKEKSPEKAAKEEPERRQKDKPSGSKRDKSSGDRRDKVSSPAHTKKTSEGSEKVNDPRIRKRIGTDISESERSIKKDVPSDKRESDIDYEDETLGYSGITIKPKRKDSPSRLPAGMSSPSKKATSPKPLTNHSASPAPSASSTKSHSSKPSAKESPEKILAPEPPPKNTSSSSSERRRTNSSKDKDSKPLKEKSSSSRKRRSDDKSSSSSARSSKGAARKERAREERDMYTHRKSLVLGRNYRKRSDLPIDEQEEKPVPRQASPGHADVDLRFDLLKDVDLRGAGGGVKLDTDGAVPPVSKKSKSSTLIDNLFGREDVDLRQPSSSWSQVKKPSRHGRGHDSGHTDEDIHDMLRDGRSRPPSAISPASSVGSISASNACDPLGRPLVFARLPDDPDERRRSLGSRSASIDPLEHFRIRYIETPSRASGGLSAEDLRYAFVRVKEELDLDLLNDSQYNLIIKQLIQINETTKIREVQQLDLEHSPSMAVVPQNSMQNPWAAEGNPFVQMPAPRPNFRPRAPDPAAEFGGPAWGGNPQFNRPRGPNPFVEAQAAAVVPAPVPQINNLLPLANPREIALLQAEYDSTIPLDKVPRQVRFYGETAIVLIGNLGDEPREISFQNESQPRVVTINREPMKCRIGETRTMYVGRTKHTVKIGAPTREIYIDGIGYEVCFGGAPAHIQHEGEWLNIRLEGDPPSVEIGAVKRYDLVAGRTTIFIDGNPVPLFLDEKPQLVDFCGFPVVLRFCDEFYSVALNGRPFPTNFGGMPRAVTVPGGRQLFIRFSSVSPQTQQNMLSHIRLRGLGSVPDDVLLSDGPAGPRERSGPPMNRGRGGRGGTGRGHFGPERPDLHEPVSRNLDEFPPLDMLANLLPTTDAKVPRNSEKSYAAVESREQSVDRVERNKEEPAVPDPVNLQDLLSKLMMAGLLPSGANTKEPQADTVPKAGEPLKKEGLKDGKVVAAEADSTKIVITPPSSQPKPPEFVNLRFNDNQKERRQKLIDQLYVGVQCGSCGLRFPPDQTFAYTQHLDWHFKQNRREKSNFRRALSRKWYYDLSDWIQFENMDDLEDRTVPLSEGQDDDMTGDDRPGARVLNPDAYTVLALGHEGALCPQCGEEFETFYDEEKEEWRLRDALLDNELSKLFHPICHQDYMASSVAEEESLLEQPKEEEMEVTVLPAEEEDEVVILKEGKKEVIVMEVDIEDQEEVPKSPTDPNPVINLEDEPVKDSVDSPTPNVSSFSYTVLSPILVLDDEIDENSNSNIPGIFGSARDGGEKSTADGIFGIALNSDASSAVSAAEDVTKRIVYENWKFDFPKIKEEPVEWEDVAEDQVIMTALEANESETPMDITLDDEDSRPVPSPLPPPTAQTYFDIDLTNEEDEVDRSQINSVVAEIDGNLQFKGSSAPTPALGKIRINITGMDIASQSPTQNPPEEPAKDLKPSLPVPPESIKSDYEPPLTSADLEALFNSEEMKRLKPRLAGRKFINNPVKVDRKAEESGLCVIS